MITSIEKVNINFAKEIDTISKVKKSILALAYIERQQNLVFQFDNTYDENYATLFKESIEKGFNNILNNNTNSNKSIVAELEESVPDTEEFDRIEGSYAQNAMISLIYFFDFLSSGEISIFDDCVEKVLETIDLVNYEKDENYNSKPVITAEIEILQIILNEVNKNEDVKGSINAVREIAKKYVIVG
jgi:hypothetical protein